MLGGVSNRSQPTRAREEGGLLPISELNALIDDPNTPQDIRERLIAQREERGLAPLRLTAAEMEEAFAEPAKPAPWREPRSALERIRRFFRIR
jgi:hypothetical protein